MTADETDELVRRFYAELWNEWDDHAVEDILTETFRFRGSLGDETSGREEWRQYRNMVRAGSPDFWNEIVELVCQGARGAARLSCSGHHRGPLLGMTATGRSFRYAAAAFFRCLDGQIDDVWVVGDLDDLRNQLSGPSAHDRRS